MPGTPTVLHGGIGGVPLPGNDYNDNLFLIEQSFLGIGPYVITGLVPSIGAGLAVNISAGAAVVGAYQNLAGFVIGSLTPSTTNHLYLLENGTGTANTTGTAPVASAKLGTCVTGVATVTSVSDGRDSGRQQFVMLQNEIHGGSAAGLPSAGQPRTLHLNSWNATDGEGFEVSGVLPPGAVSGMGARTIVTKTANYTLVWGTDEVVLANAAGGAFTLTLPTAVGHSGNGFTIKKIDNTANVVHIATTGGQTIDTVASPHDLTSPQVSIDLLSDGSNWLLT